MDKLDRHVRDTHAYTPGLAVWSGLGSGLDHVRRKYRGGAAVSNGHHWLTATITLTLTGVHYSALGGFRTGMG